MRSCDVLTLSLFSLFLRYRTFCVWCTSKASTKKLRALPLCDKVEILHRIQCGQKKKKRNITVHLGIAASTLGTIFKRRRPFKSMHRNNLMQIAVASGSQPTTNSRNPCRNGLWISVHKIYLSVAPFCSRRCTAPPPSWTLHDLWGAADGRRGLSTNMPSLEMVVKRHAVNSDNANKQIENVWHQVTKKYEPCNIFNKDGAALFWRMLLSRALAIKNGECHGGKLIKAHVTVVTTSINGS